MARRVATDSLCSFDATIATSHIFDQPEPTMNSRYCVVLLIATMAQPAFAAESISGKWMTTERDSIIEIGQCGSVTCGKVLHVFKVGPDGKRMLDSHNPSPELRDRPVQGINVLTDFRDAGSDWRGKIYDPKSGKSYKAFASRKPDGNLLVQGCIAFICRSFTWTPAR
jgi:uncharacterized protein (DUF2147 family)